MSIYSGSGPDIGTYEYEEELPVLHSLYVDATLGSDSNPGSQAQPWQTLSKVNSYSFAPGDFLYLKRGETWREQLTFPSSGTQAEHITITSYGSGAQPIINGSDLKTGWTLDSGVIYSISLATNPTQVLEDGTGLTKVALKASMVSGSWFYSSGVLYVQASDDTDPDTHTMEVGSRTRCIYISAKNYIDISDIAFGKNRSEDYAACDVSGSLYVTVKSCTVTSGLTRGIWYHHGSNYSDVSSNTITIGYGHSDYGNIMGILYGTYGDATSACSSALVSDNTITCSSSATSSNALILRYVTGYSVHSNMLSACSEHGLYLDHCTTGDCYSNLIHDIGDDAVASIGLAMEDCTTVDCYSNTVYNITRAVGAIDAVGIFVDQNTSYADVYFNRVYATDGTGIHFYIATNCRAFYNIVYDVGNDYDADNKRAAICIGTGCTYIELYNNTLSPEEQYGIKAVGSASNTHHITIKNNIINLSTVYAIYVDANAIGNLTSDYNNFYFAAGKCGYYNTTACDALSDWQTASSQDANSLSVLPNFENLAADNFHLANPNPCVDVGVAITGLDEDIEGNPVPRQGGVDMGAYESDYTGGGTLTVYYVDATDGLDTNTGGTPETAWQTVAKVNAATFNPGDQILFKRGETWREKLEPPSAGSLADGVITYGAYGTGDKPIICGSVAKNDAGDWTQPTATFADGFESGSAAGWTDTLDDVDITRTFTGASAKHGSYGMRCAIAGAGTSTVRKTDLGANITPCYCRFYVRFVTGFSMTNADQFGLMICYTVGWAESFSVQIYKTGGNHFMWMKSADNVGNNFLPGYQGAGYACNALLDNAWHLIECYQYPHASAGAATFWVDGVQVGAITGKANDTKTCRLFSFGVDSVDVGTSGSVDSDDFSVGTSYFGPSNSYLATIISEPNFIYKDGTTLLTKKTTPIMAADGDWYYSSLNGAVYVFGATNPTTGDHTFEIGQRDYCIEHSQNYCTFDNLELRYCNSELVICWGATNATFNDCDFYDSQGNALQFHNGSNTGLVHGCTFTDWGLITDSTYGVQAIKYGAVETGPVDITDCIFTATVALAGTDCGAVMNDEGGWIRNIQRNTITGNAGYVRGDGIVIWRPASIATTHLIEDNVITDIGGIGITVQDLEFYGATPTATVRYNWIENSNIEDVADKSAIRARIFTNASTVSIYYNIINGTASGANGHHGIHNQRGDATKIWNNVIYAADQGIKIDDDSGDYSIGLDVRNNICSTNRGYGLWLSASNTITSWGYNCWNGNADGTISGKAAGTGDVTDDPTFTTIGTDFHLAAGSPCINTGTDVGLTADYDGSVVDAVPCIGAYESTYSGTGGGGFPPIGLSLGLGT